MTFDIGLVIAILLVAVALFVSEKLRVDVVALTVLLALALRRAWVEATPIATRS